MKKIQIILALLVVALTIVSCDPSESSSHNNGNFAENFGSAVNRSFIGQVVDTDNHPLQNVTVNIGTSTVQTDANGVFIINDAPVYEKFAHITAKKIGYIDGSRSMVPTSGKNNVKIMLIPNAPLQTIQSGVASEVALPSGTKVNFDGAFQDENGANYTGSVQVSMFHLKPSDENISSLMPGMLYAERENGNEAILETFGMLNVELRGSGGQKLNLANGHTAQITIKIDDSQTATAPNSIPLWHFDEEGGYWKEDGEATKIGNNYVGTVSHFSWWNCDAPFPTVLLSLTVVDTNGNPISNAAVGLIANGNIYPRFGFTDNDGHVSGLVPSNQTITLNVYANYNTCGTSDILYTSSIGPFTTDTTLPNIVIANSSSILISNVIGNLVKCDNTNVTNGYIVLTRLGGYSFAPITNGAFSFNELYCPGNTQFKLKGVDYDNLQETDSISYNFTTPITNVGNLQACNAIEEFISYKIDNNPTVFRLDNLIGDVYNQNTALQNSLYIRADSQELGSFSIAGNSLTPGIYTTPQFTMESGSFGPFGSTFLSPSTPNTVQFNLSHVGAIGEYIEMTFYGTYYYESATHTVIGVVHVKRDQ